LGSRWWWRCGGGEVADGSGWLGDLGEFWRILFSLSRIGRLVDSSSRYTRLFWTLKLVKAGQNEVVAMILGVLGSCLPWWRLARLKNDQTRRDGSNGGGKKDLTKRASMYIK
jgi:hypothetical protein